MEDWQKNLVEMLETVADEVENFLLDINEAIESFTVFSEEVAEQLQATISYDIEQLLNAIVEPLIDPHPELDDTIFDREWSIGESEESLEDSLFKQHPACVGCRHFHGHSYGGNLLVCGMHPYGSEGDSCPDWEAGERIDNDYNSPFNF